MKTTAETVKGGFLIARVSFSVFLGLLAAGAATAAVQLKEARVTQIVKDVKLVGAQGQRAAAISDDVRDGTMVRTGTDSRAELTFTDLTLTRLGANTIFSFNAGAREVDLAGGAVLLSVPKNGAAVKVITAAVTAAVTGGTALFEYHKGMPAKLLIMEGKGEFCSRRRPDDCVTVRGGEMAVMTADGRILPPTKFNANTVFKTSKLIVGFPALPNEALIMDVIDEQQAEMNGTTDSPPKDQTGLDTLSQAAAGAGGSSAKFGPPTAIAVPNPYHITSGTQINTDPTITTNGVTDIGKIYRGAAQDGPLPAWLGTTPSAFDSVDFFDSTSGGFNSPDTLPIPGFLFASLQLDGDPTVSNSSNFPALALVSQTGITATAAGTAYTFSGMPEVGLIALNGSIDISNASFSNFGQLFLYARGGGSSVTIGSAASFISNLSRVEARAEGDIAINGPVTVTGTQPDKRGFKALSGNNLTVNAPITSTGGRILLQSLGGISLANSSQLHTLLDSMGGNGGIVVLASGSDTAINVSGSVQADSGEVDIRQTGVAGMTTLNNATIHGDVVKISALGNNGTLRIGNGNSINADTVIKLYAPGSNGTLRFMGDVTLNSPSNILAANTITIDPSVTVTINSAAKASVFTNNPDYNFVPQPGYNGPPPNATNGMFAGAGANDPRPLSQAPALGAPGTGP